MGRKLIDLVGKIFGRWVVISQAENIGEQTCWNCICECGVERVVYGFSLKTGNSKSCGCYGREVSKRLNTTHGMTGTSEFMTWESMRRRCNNPKNKAYKDYGGRGITICERWQNDFENFYEDMGKRPKGMTLDRIDNDGNYCKENCKWSTVHEQSCNRRTNNETIGIRQTSSGNWSWQASKGKFYHGTEKTKELAAKAYDDKCEEWGRGRPNGTS